MSLDILLLIGAVIVLVAVMVAKLGDRMGLPALLLFLALGVGLRMSSAAFAFDNSALAHDLGFLALVLILAEGGLSTKWHDIRPAIGPAALLATAGVGLTIAGQVIFGHLVLGLSLAAAVLLGAIMAPTDSAAVFSVLRRVSVPPRVRSILEGESGLNDAPTVLLVVAGTNLAIGTTSFDTLPSVLVEIIVELVGGVLLGAALGFVGVWILRGLALPSSGLYPLAALGWAVLAYGVGVWLHLSGFAAVYVCAVVLGNGKLPHRHATRSFAEGIGWIAQIGLFVMLGLLVVPSRITLTEVLIATAAGLFLTLVVRPLSVLACLTPFGVPLRQQLFISWAGLRGAVPIILATIPMAAGVGHAQELFDLVFIAVIILTLLNAPSLGWLARKLGLAGDTVDVDVEAAPLDKVDADMVQVRIVPGSKLHGVAVQELRLPPNATVALVIRGERTFTPHGRDVLRTGDELLIVTPSAVRPQIEERIRMVGRSGRLAGWTDPVDPQ